jgi:hypothetical protein
MHRSRLFGLFIDTPPAETPAAATFWAGAFGTTATPIPGEEQFITLGHRSTRITAAEDHGGST